jgi:hypothetical protein
MGKNSCFSTQEHPQACTIARIMIKNNNHIAANCRHDLKPMLDLLTEI